MSRYSFAGPSIEQAVLHHDDESYAAAIASGHKDTYAPEAWGGAMEGDDSGEEMAEESECDSPKRGRGRPPKVRE